MVEAKHKKQKLLEMGDLDKNVSLAWNINISFEHHPTLASKKIRSEKKWILQLYKLYLINLMLLGWTVSPPPPTKKFTQS